MRGTIAVCGAGQGIGSKPRPVLIVQHDGATDTVTVLVTPLTTTLREVPVWRPTIDPSPENGLISRSDAMIEKTGPVLRARIGQPIGHLSAADLTRIDRALTIVLGLAA